MKDNPIVCPLCNGKGEEEFEYLTDYHKSEYTSEYEKCKTCDGSGLVWKTEKIIYEPFKPTTLHKKFPRKPKDDMYIHRR